MGFISERLLNADDDDDDDDCIQAQQFFDYLVSRFILHSAFLISFLLYRASI